MGQYTAVILRIFLEIGILWLIIYGLLLFIKGTRAAQLLKGLVIVILLFILSQKLGLTVLNWLLTKIFALSVIGALIIFQPEIRRGLARIGQFGIFTAKEQIVDEIVDAACFMSEAKIGALIAIEREVGLGTYVESGVPLDSKISSELLISIFTPPNPLHDGAVVVQLDRVVAAGCLFPLAQESSVARSLGTRHRAAVGLTEETDAVVVVVSEETGSISIGVKGKLTRNLNRDTLYKILSNLLYKQRQK